MPEDLLAAVAAVPEAQAMFDVLTKTNRYALVHRLGGGQAGGDPASARSREFVAMLARHEAPHPQKARPESPPAS